MLVLHVAICFIGLLAGALILIALCRGEHQAPWAATLLASTALISLTGFVLPSPPGTPTPDPARIVGVVELDRDCDLTVSNRVAGSSALRRDEPP